MAGFDDVAQALVSRPSLTTVRQPFYEQGVHAVKTVLDVINNRPVDDKIVLPTGSVFRRSCGCPSSDFIQAAVSADSPARQHASDLVLQMNLNETANRLRASFTKEDLFTAIEEKFEGLKIDGFTHFIQ